ncbi:Vegetative incompatibility protein HET-E-1 [Lachnellula hyalina]|uniref:Vegetative incompatibility protein HET-E-1 n=1 Tax=Lachnellula hyalina TaxID=1316788 RepID=A0A8H8QUV9_9HELO|nr:Vegetative incompatibility protein HET-E-1 [Lachnellula hyalina]TVY23213.1 Vegetative incompatibility protein HET-E-1 [Lachnellula hyalina]
MRLLNVKSLQIELFSGSNVSAYVILSHCWGGGEVSFEDISVPGAAWLRKVGARKIKYACEQSMRDQWAYVWIDTCCIDKRSSAELSEAINSMYNWYEESHVCYVYLEDVLGGIQILPETDLDLQFHKSRWFTRGWTLQELIAPNYVLFYDKTWRPVGSREALASHISAITKIPEKILKEPLELGIRQCGKENVMGSREADDSH